MRLSGPMGGPASGPTAVQQWSNSGPMGGPTSGPTECLAQSGRPNGFPARWPNRVVQRRPNNGPTVAQQWPNSGPTTQHTLMPSVVQLEVHTARVAAQIAGSVLKSHRKIRAHAHTQHDCNMIDDQRWYRCLMLQYNMIEQLLIHPHDTRSHTQHGLQRDT